MFAKDGRVANMAVGVPQVPYARVSEQQKEEIIKYLTATFGPGSKARDLKTDPLVRDEQALSTALYVQYELKRSVADRKFANGLAPVLGGHSAFASLANPGVVYISGNSSNSILRVDTRDPNYDTRTKEFWIDNPGNVNTTPHGIVELNGKIWFTELGGDRIEAVHMPRSVGGGRVTLCISSQVGCAMGCGFCATASTHTRTRSPLHTDRFS